jgi:hypothetical protein
MAAGKGESDIHCPPEYPIGIEDAHEMLTRIIHHGFFNPAFHHEPFEKYLPPFSQDRDGSLRLGAATPKAM